MEILRSQDCGNSPKNQLVENLTIALLTGEFQTQYDTLTEDAQWNILGVKSLPGRKAILAEIETIRSRPILKLSVEHAITHGKAGMVNGKVQYDTEIEGFCFVFEFANAKGTNVCQINSYHLSI